MTEHTQTHIYTYIFISVLHIYSVDQKLSVRTLCNFAHIIQNELEALFSFHKMLAIVILCIYRCICENAWKFMWSVIWCSLHCFLYFLLNELSCHCNILRLTILALKTCQ